MAGLRFTQELHGLLPGADITVVGDEPGGAYNRVLLSGVLAGTTRGDAITMADESWYTQHGVTLVSGIPVTAVDRAARMVRLADGATVSYDVLVLATGSAPLVPPIAGLRRPDGAFVDGVAAFRARADCLAIDAWAAAARSAVVVGAGVLGLEAARALAGRGLAVTVVQREDRLMERQLDPAAGRVLDRTLSGLGIAVVAGVTVAQVTADERITGVTLSDGRHVPAELVVLCCGVRPQVELARDAGLHVATGIVVDDRLRSSDQRILAIGECAEHRGQVYGLVAPVWEQARVAAAVLANRRSPARYTGSVPITRLKAAGIELAAMGDRSAHAADDAATDLVTFVDAARGIYQKLVVEDGRLVAAILLGDTRTAGTLSQLFERRAVLPPDRASLLMARRSTPAIGTLSPTALPARATICRCNGVTKAMITAAWQAGARTVDEIAAATRATTGCGTCRDAVCGLADWLAGADTDPAVRPA
jgi:assimilatory nitrate reductase electron transfer subunit